MKAKKITCQGFLSIIPILGLFCMSTASAQSNWTSTTGTDWNDPANWSAGVPTSSVVAQINNGGTATIGAGITANASALNIANIASGSGEINILGGGVLNVAGNIVLNINNNAISAVMNIDGGRVTSSGYTHVAYNSSGTLNITNGGQLTNSGNQSIIARAAGANGAANISGAGSIWTTNQLQISYNANGVLNVWDQGTVISTGAVTMAGNSVGYGEANITNSGTWLLTGNAANSTFIMGVSGTGVLNIDTGGLVRSGVMTLGNGSATSKGVINLRGSVMSSGTLETTSIAKGAGTGTIAFNGGVLRARENSTSFISGVTVTTQGNGAFIDSNGFDVRVTGDVSFTGAGGLTKLGAGKLTLNNTLGYTGATLIEGGALEITSSGQLNNSSGIVIAVGGTLASTAAQSFADNISGAGDINLGINALTFNNTSALSLSGKITAGDFTKNGASTLSLSGNNNSITGNVTLNGGLLELGSLGAGAGKTFTITSGALAAVATGVTIQHDVVVQSGLLFTVGSSVSDFKISGAVTADSGITKTGSGSLALTGNLSALSGPITVNQGGLFLNTYDTGGTDITVANGAAFGGAGTITGNINFLGDGILQAGFTHNDYTISESSTLTINGTVNFAGAATLRYDIYATGADAIVASNIVFGNATNTIDLINIQTGTFTLFKLTSGTFDSSILSGLTTTQDGGALNSVRASADYALSTDKTELQLISGKTSQIIAWTGATDSSWDSATDNWTGGDTKFLSGDKVIFNASGSHDIDITASAVVSEMSVTDGSYNFTGGRLVVDASSVGNLGASFGGVSPTGDFTINTTGTVTLANTLAPGEMNYFQNGINVQQGTLIGSVATLGDSNIVNNGKTVFHQEGNDTYTGTMTGSGIFGKSGGGVLFIGNNLSGFTGNTELAGGSLVIADDVTFNSPSITGSNTNLVGGNNVTLTGSTVIRDGSVMFGQSARTGLIQIDGLGDIILGDYSIINGYAIAGSGTGSILTGDNVTISGSASASNGSIWLGDYGLIQGAATVHTFGDIVLGVSGTISGDASTGKGSIQLGNDSFIGGAASVGSDGHIMVGNNSSINGAATIGGVGNIEAGNNSIISGSASTYAGNIILGNTSIIQGPTTVNTVGNIVIGASSTIGGYASTGSGTIQIEDDSLIDGAATVGSNGNILVGSNGRINGAVIIVGTGTIATGTNVIINGPASTNAGSIILDENSIIQGAATVNTTGNIVLGVSTTIGGAASVGTGTISIDKGSRIDGPATVTGSGAIVAGINVVIGGDASVNQGNITLGENSIIQGAATISATGNIVVGGTSAITGAASVGTGNITINADGRIDGSATVVDVGNIAAGNNTRIDGAASVGTGTITIGNNSSINGHASAGTGRIVIGNNSIVNGNATITNGTADSLLSLGVSSTITGAAFVDSGSINLQRNSQLGGGMTLGDVDVFLAEGTRVGGPVTGVSSHIHLTSGTTAGPSQIMGDVTLTGTIASVTGAGKIHGTIYTGTESSAVVGPGNVTYSSGTWSIGYPDTAILEVDKIVFGGSVSALVGGGTLATESIHFNDALAITNNNLSGTFVITGSIVGSGYIQKNGAGAAVLKADSNYAGDTVVTLGTLIAGTPRAFSPNSPRFIISADASLSMGGFDYSLPEVYNDGRIYIGGNNVPVAGTTLKITGPYTSNFSGTSNGGVVFNIVAGDKIKTASDLLVFANAANISGTTKVFVQFTDNREDWTRVVYDLDPIIIAESGTLIPGTFILDDGRGYERVVMSQRDYAAKYTEKGVELIATTAAEMPAALAANAVSIMANRASYGSVGQRLDYLRSANALPGNDGTGVQVWAQTYYRADKLDGKLFPDSDGTVWGIQAGVDKRKTKEGNAYLIYGALIDRTEASATLTNKTKTDLSSTGLGGYISARTVNNWHADLVLRYTWDSYKITIGDPYTFKHGTQSMETDGYTWGAMVRLAKNVEISNGWSLIPQAQLTYQHRRIKDTIDSFGRPYVFGPETNRNNEPASFEGRLGAGLRKIYVISDKISVAPYVSSQLLYEFKGDLVILSVNNAVVKEDFGGSSCLFTVGLPVRFSRRIDAYLDATMQTGGPITGYGLNLGINYRW